MKVNKNDALELIGLAIDIAVKIKQIWEKSNQNKQ
jgi:hypothetical protein